MREVHNTIRVIHNRMTEVDNATRVIDYPLRVEYLTITEVNKHNAFHKFHKTKNPDKSGFCILKTKITF